MPLAMLFAFDEIPVVEKALLILGGAVILAVGGGVYMRASNRWVGIGVLLLSALLVWGYANSAAWLYWRMVG
jgi:glucose dehydrogenase